MGFTTSCFIRKNTPELRKRLEALGYRPLLCIKDGECLCTTSNLGHYHSIPATLFDNKDPHSTYDCVGRIDCGTNEELFLAIAALRDDTSANQYWVFDQDFLPHYKKGDFTIGHFNRCSCYCHVATVKELIEHFLLKEK